MRSVCVLLVVVVVVRAVDYYVTDDDYFDYESVVQNPSELKKHLDCYLYKGPCTKLLETFREHSRTGISDYCARCSPPQKHLFRVFIEGLKKVYPDGYKEYRQLYDPTGEHFDKLEAAVAGY